MGGWQSRGPIGVSDKARDHPWADLDPLTMIYVAKRLITCGCVAVSSQA